MGLLKQSQRCALAAGILALTLSHGVSSLRAQTAELVVRNANVLTVDAANSKATAFAVAGGKLLAVGSDDDVKPHIGAKTRVVDLKGKTVTPGFIDAHCHPTPVYPEDRLWASVDLFRTKTMDDLVEALKKKAAKTPNGQTVWGERYRDTLLGRHPTRKDLDRVSTEHPVILSHSSGHLRVCNSYALKLAKLDKDTANPPGGEFERDARGELTGVLKESAASSRVTRSLPPVPEPPQEEVIEGYRLRFREYFKKGITGIHVAGTNVRTAELLALASSDLVPMHLYVMLREGEIEEAVKRQKMAPKAGRVRFGPIKFFHGNSLSGQTCWLSAPYVHRKDYFGIPPARSQARLNDLVLQIHKAGLQGCVHSNGDREIDMVLTAFENALAKHPRADHRHRIEHCSVVTADILKRIKKLGLVVAPHSYVLEHGETMEAYGEARWDWMHADRLMIDMGIPVAGNSDSPVSPADPLTRMQSMVTRRCETNGKVYGAKLRTTPEQALAAWTRGGAFASFEEANRGSLEKGKRADFLILANDPTKVDAETIRDIAVETTVIAGRVVAGVDPF
jgi:predicted amidohydrolase YtcJ